LRNLVAVAVLFGLSYSLFPHYQSLGRSRLNLSFVDLVPWMIAQNVGVTLFSIPIGWVADRWGNRLALIFLMAGSLAAPLLAVGITTNTTLGEGAYSLVFLLLGMMPLTMRIATNLALELAEPAQQPLYVSITNLALSLPVVGLSLLIGWLIDLAGFEMCFLLVAAGLLLGFPLVWRVQEPRHRVFPQEIGPTGHLSSGSNSE
jgi:MFS family permease